MSSYTLLWSVSHTHTDFSFTFRAWYQSPGWPIQMYRDVHWAVREIYLSGRILSAFLYILLVTEIWEYFSVRSLLGCELESRVVVRFCFLFVFFGNHLPGMKTRFLSLVYSTYCISFVFAQAEQVYHSLCFCTTSAASSQPWTGSGIFLLIGAVLITRLDYVCCGFCFFVLLK